MARKKSRMFGKDKEPEQKTQTVTEEQKEVKIEFPRCVTCVSCDVRNNGFCNNQEARGQLDLWNGIVNNPNEFGCILHEENPDTTEGEGG